MDAEDFAGDNDVHSAAANATAAFRKEFGIRWKFAYDGYLEEEEGVEYAYKLMENQGEMT